MEECNSGMFNSILTDSKGSFNVIKEG